MKNLRPFLLTLIVAFLAFSCDNGELTKKKAEKIIKADLKAKPFLKYGKMPVKFNTFPQSKNDVYFAYEELGLVKLIETNRTDLSVHYTQDLTEKGKKHLAQGYKYNGKNSYMVIYWEHTLKEVQEVHVNPSNNTARVKVIMERSDPTPFGQANMKKYKTKETFDKTYKFKKTTDGWIWNYSYKDYTGQK